MATSPNDWAPPDPPAAKRRMRHDPAQEDVPRGSPRPQHGLRDPVTPHRPRPVVRYTPTDTARRLAVLATRLTPRDFWLIAMLHEHRVLTTHAISTMAFESDHSARRRLLRLHEWEVLDRFTPRLPVGTAPSHYVLGPAGAAVLAARFGLTLRSLGYRRDRSLAIAHHYSLSHTVAVNDLFAHLVGHSVHADWGLHLDSWWSESRCRRHLDYVRPDAYGRISFASHGETVMLEWFLELDFATNPLDALAAKLDSYAQLAAVTRPRPVLLWLPTSTREAHAHERLSRALATTRSMGYACSSDSVADLVPVATATAPIAAVSRDGTHSRGFAQSRQVTPSGSGPADAVWLPLGRHRNRGRLDLVGLAELWAVPPAEALDNETRELDQLVDDFAGPSLVELPAPRPVPPDSSQPMTHPRRS